MTSWPAGVLHVQRYGEGGSLQSLLLLIRHLDRSRFRPVVLFPSPPDDVAAFQDAGAHVLSLSDIVSATPAAGASARVPLLAAHTREIRRTVRRDLPAARHIARLIREHGIALVHTNNDLASNRDALFAAVGTRTPAIAHLRGIPRYRVPSQAWLIDIALARRLRRVVYISEAVRHAHRPLRIPEERGQVVDNPFDMPAPSRNGAEVARSLGLSPRDRPVVHVGRLTPWKGQHVLIEALPRVLDAHPSARAVIVGAPSGAGGDGYLAHLRSLVASLALGDRVVFAGLRADIADVLGSAEVVVHSSVEPEPFGRTIVEAMVAGRPVVAVDEGGPKELVVHRSTGLLVPPRNPDALASAIIELLDDSARANALAAAGREYVARRFGAVGHAEAMGRVYDAVLDRPPA